MDKSIYFSQEHTMLRDQIRRFINERVIPYGEQWEEDHLTPRDVLREMGDLAYSGSAIQKSMAVLILIRSQPSS